MKSKPPVWKILICPACGARVDTEENDGHYHDPPPGWPPGEGPWFDGVAVEVVPLHLAKDGEYD